MRPVGQMNTGEAIDDFLFSMPFRPVYDHRGDDILRSHEASLHRLGLVHVDLILVHDIGRRALGDRQWKYWKHLTKGGGLRALSTLRDTCFAKGTPVLLGRPSNRGIAICTGPSRHIPCRRRLSRPPSGRARCRRDRPSHSRRFWAELRDRHRAARAGGTARGCFADCLAAVQDHRFTLRPMT
jgi:hypothetical protein